MWEKGGGAKEDGIAGKEGGREGGRVSGELVAGDNKYHCSECGKKVEALQRMALQVGREGGREGGVDFYLFGIPMD